MNIESEYGAAYKGRVGADRMALRLAIIPDKLRGDMDEVKRLRDALKRIADTDYRGNRSTESQLAYQTLNPTLA